MEPAGQTVKESSLKMTGSEVIVAEGGYIYGALGSVVLAVLVVVSWRWSVWFVVRKIGAGVRADGLSPSLARERKTRTRTRNNHTQKHKHTHTHACSLVTIKRAPKLLPSHKKNKIRRKDTKTHKRRQISLSLSLFFFSFFFFFFTPP